ncbi:hypothetical protein FQR65_LT19949 [Abscondita terminalis]|nr:hypothetical protein FQR65_LT19949 [Abscondita terminalis]
MQRFGRNEYRRKHGMVPADAETIDLLDSLHQAKLLNNNEMKIYADYLHANTELKAYAVVSFALFGQVKAQNLVENGGFESWISDTEPEAFGPFTTGTLSWLLHAASIEKNGIDGLKVYPNPVLSTDRLYISSKENRAKEIVFYDLLGKKVLETTLPQDDFINISMLRYGNNSRSNRKFASGSGNAAIVANGNFYPGDEWKGDIARMMMYMYLRYPNQCPATVIEPEAYV